MASIFTRIIEGEIPGRFVWSDPVCIAMIDIRPLHPGHVLVIPRAEVDHWLDLELDTIQHLTEVSTHVGKAQRAIIECQRIGLMIAGFEVPHTHLHVVPMQGMEQLDFRTADADADPADLDAMAEALRETLRRAGHGACVP